MSAYEMTHLESIIARSWTSSPPSNFEMVQPDQETSSTRKPAERVYISHPQYTPVRVVHFRDDHWYGIYSKIVFIFIPHHIDVQDT